MGIGGLDNEFNAIFRRAFASRVFPPEVVEQLGEFLYHGFDYILSRNLKIVNNNYYMSKIAAMYAFFSDFGALIGVYFWNKGSPIPKEVHTWVIRIKL